MKIWMAEERDYQRLESVSVEDEHLQQLSDKTGIKEAITVVIFHYLLYISSIILYPN